MSWVPIVSFLAECELECPEAIRVHISIYVLIFT